MPLTAKGEEIMAAMKKQYGPDKGESVFYAAKNAGTITGVDSADLSVTDRIDAIAKRYDAMCSRFDDMMVRAESRPRADARGAEGYDKEEFVVVTETGSKKIFSTQAAAVAAAKKIKGAWVGLRGGPNDGEVVWQPRGDETYEGFPVVVRKADEKYRGHPVVVKDGGGSASVKGMVESILRT